MIPPEIQASRAAMEEFASVFAKECRWRVWLVLSKRNSVWFNEKGERTGVTEDTCEGSLGPFDPLLLQAILIREMGPQIRTDQISHHTYCP